MQARVKADSKKMPRSSFKSSFEDEGSPFGKKQIGLKVKPKDDGVENTRRQQSSSSPMSGSNNSNCVSKGSSQASNQYVNKQKW